MIDFPNAKINIGLSIVEKRSDGFHNIETVFYPIPISDCLEVVENGVFEFKNTGLHIDAPLDKNLCVKAYELLKKDFDLRPVKIILHKEIPFGAGLGGGSSDAAFTLKLINKFQDLNLSDSDLQSYARRLGSDCAFFVKNAPVFAYEKGDVFNEIELSLAGKYLLLVKPDIFISTPKAYSGVSSKAAIFNLAQLASLSLNEWKKHVINDFEHHLFKEFPLLESIKQTLYNIGAEYASMSGSGSSMYGIFNELPEFKNDLFNGMFVRTMKL